MKITWSDGNWLYTFRCRECDLRYECRPTNLPIGPMFLTKASDLIDSVDGIDCYESVMVYDGPRRELKCADCLLKPFFPLAIDADLWGSWMADHAGINPA